MARELTERGGQVVGLVDPSLAGRPVAGLLDPTANVAEETGGGGAVVAASLDDLPAGTDAQFALIAAPVDPAELEAMVCGCLQRRINVITIHEDAFDPPPEFAAAVDACARTHGVSFLATGVQDVWWVHLPAVAASSMSTLRAVRARHAIDLEQASRGYGELLALGGDPAVFPGIRDGFLSAGSSILGAPLRVLAQLLGLTPGEISRTIEPVVAATATRWRLGERDIAPGTLAGFTEIASFTTEEGVDFTGTFHFCLTDPEEPYDELLLEGDPELRLEHRPFPGDRLTDTIPIARIPDVIAASPGLHSVAAFAPPRYRHHPASRSVRPIQPSGVDHEAK